MASHWCAVGSLVHCRHLHSRPVTRGCKEGEGPLEIFSPPLEKCVGYSLKLLDIVQKIWAPLRQLFAPPGVPSWLRACFTVVGKDYITENKEILLKLCPLFPHLCTGQTAYYNDFCKAFFYRQNVTNSQN